MSKRPVIPYLRNYSYAIRAMGFVREFDTCSGGTRTVQFLRGDRNRGVFFTIQLWADGGHRVSSGKNGREVLRPSEFSSQFGMYQAIARQAFAQMESP